MNRYARPLLALGLVGVLVACAPTADEPGASPTTAPTTAAAAEATTPPQSASQAPMPTEVEPSETPNDMGGMDHATEEVEVRIDNFAFVDEIIEVSVGTTVTWVNGDSTRHTVTSGADDSADGRFDGDVAGGETFSFTFDEAGEFAYFCDIHPTMTGLVIVTP